MLHSYDASIKKGDALELTDYTGSGQRKFESEQGIRFPVVAKFDINGKKLHYFAARHGSGENHPTLIKVQSLIEELKPDCLILEGFDNTPESIQNVTEYISSAINLKTTGEPMYAAYLASKHNIPFIGGEPTNLEIQARLNYKYTDEDFVFYNFIKWIPSAARQGIKLNSISAYLEKYWGDSFGKEIENYKLNSVFNFGASSDEIDETEYYFEHTTHDGCYIRIMATEETNTNSIAYPAIVSDQECNFMETNLSENLKIYHAWSKNNDNGCHSIILKVKNLIFNISVKPSAWTSINYTREFCKKLAKYLESCV